MKNKTERLQAIKEIIINNRIGNQDDLLNILTERGFDLTQATLSRDLKQLQIAKVPSTDKGYMYVLPGTGSIGKIMQSKVNNEIKVSPSGFISIEFSGQIAVIKTRPGYASGIAYDIDSRATKEILGTIAGDDTILLILREGIRQEDILASLTDIIPNIQ
ncbi:arginine repressor [Coprobacter tertius]|uniref:Arginine repressor n=1 Tax=Coprobacter tertius TaxID=2944915 RepID=A0ABT1MKK0_9BACT|nr:ArgR family transcriptional regulator [Coprobacter tertius]MCP9612899.1 ArgR family transcriptional regulator [Coprobacter tertius]